MINATLINYVGVDVHGDDKAMFATKFDLVYQQMIFMINWLE